MHFLNGGHCVCLRVGFFLFVFVYFLLVFMSMVVSTSAIIVDED